MALILPQNLPPPTDPIAARLEATLASLPDDWTLLPGRRIGGADGPRIGFTLIHPAIGIALVDLLPARPDDGVARLRDLLDAEHVTGERDVLPTVAVALDPDDIPAVGERLAAAFDAAPDCDMLDGAWPARVTDLLLDAEDAAMLPLRPDAALAVEPIADLALPLAADEPVLLPAPARRHVTFAAICAAGVAVIGLGGAAAYLVTAQPADTPVVAASNMKLTPLTPPRPWQAPVAVPEPRTAPTPAPAPRAQAPMPVGPAPAPEAPPAATASAAAPPAAPLPAIADTAPPPAPTPSPPEPAPVAAKPPPAMKAAAPPSPYSPWEIALPRPTKPAPPKIANAPPKPPRKDFASAKPAPSPAKPATKRVASLEPRPEPDTAPPLDVAPPPQPAPLPTATASSGTLQPLDADQLPPLEGSSMPPLSEVPAGTPVPLPNPTPYARGTPAPGMPVMLLPPIGPPAAMPSAPGEPR
jgi:hypothetical protein